MYHFANPMGGIDPQTLLNVGRCSLVVVRFGIVPGLTILLWLEGCAASQRVHVDYDRESGVSTYESERVLMGIREMSGGLASGQRIMWQAVASCSGEDCTPQEVTLVFYNGSDGDLNIDSRRLQINFDGATRDWEDLSRLNEPEYYTVSRGPFFWAPLASADFVSLATARQVELAFGTTGTSAFTVPFERRAAFRAFARQTSSNR